jgi:hydrogenase maturation protease
MMVKPVLVFGYGNPSRGDDALGPELLENLKKNTIIKLDNIELLTDFQLQIEHALDLEQRHIVLFIDASVSCTTPFELHQLKPEHDLSYTTHAMSPAAVLQVYQAIKKEIPPPCFLLSIKAEQFELGEDLSIGAKQNLQLACDFAVRLLTNSSLAEWQKLSQNARNIAA